ncbi:hypothetical protein QTP86_010300 [Hemibagrus guttatus]|nr:hypothetical protein QTP86_010300 [Hemibagrus guttatus]
MDEDQWTKEAWDAARETPIITDEQKPRKCLSFIQIITCTFVGLLVFGLAFFSKIVSVETLVALGSSVLILVTMPKFDILTNVMLLNGIGTLSAMLQVVANTIQHGRRRFIATSLASVIFLIAGFSFFAVNYLREQNGKQSLGLFVGLAIGGTFLVSLNWWENYAMLFNIVFFQNTVRDIRRSQNFVNIVASLARIVVTSTVLGAYVKLSDQDWSSVLKVSTFTKTLVLSLFAIQVLASVLCRYMAVVACKMHAVRHSFLIPMIFASPATLGAFVLAVWVPFLQYKEQLKNSTSILYADYCSTFVIVPRPGLGIVRLLLSDLTRNMCNHTMADKTNSMGFGLLGSSLVSWWLGLVLCTLYIWFLDMGRIVRTKDLFVRNLYEAAFIDQSMLLNTKFEIALQPKQASKEQEKVTIYLCATMWHETLDEMMKMIISMFRLDKFRPKKNQFNDVVFESHIYFDDAFLTKDNKRCVNEYAETLAEVIREVYIIFSEENKSAFRERKPLPAQKIFQTPYGCRLQYTLPHGNMLFVHFKDKHQIRHKKRWSQIMYLYYLLGWRLHKNYYQMYKHRDVHLKNIEEQLQKSKENTYILALDGDTDFQPSAVMLLVDRLRLYPEVGAACGRIHPTGTGEDRWLCTLLLQQGWRVEYNAASDSYTNAPQEFKEFYNQRRRWGPSTMANTLDLLSSGRDYCTTQQVHIATLHYLPDYHHGLLNLGASYGSLKFVLNLDANFALVIAVVPPSVYLFLCYYLGQAKSDLQITIAAFMSIIYAFLMTASLLSIIGDMVKQGTFITPAGLFFIGIIVMYFITAILHPHEFHLIIFGFLYIICIPSGYLLLAIYSIVNMNNVSWGTRESANTAGGPEQNMRKNVKCQKLFKLCGYNLEVQLNKVEKVAAVQENAPQTTQLKDECKEITQPKQQNRLNLEEEKFWVNLIEQYLLPLETDKKKEERIKDELKDLRNKAAFVFFICNALWLVATFFLQVIGTAVNIRIPMTYANGTVDPNRDIFIDPIGLMFLLSFAILLIVQFLAMLWHRVQTLIHFIAYIGTESAVNRKVKKHSVAMITEVTEENIVSVETLVALGSSVLILVTMPKFDILTNVMLLNGIGFSFFAVNYLREQNGKQSLGLFVGLAIGGTFLVSLNWWENYAMLFNIVFFQNTVRDIRRSQNFVNIVASLARIVVTSTVLGAYVKLSDQDWSSVLKVSTFNETLVLSLFAIQVLASVLCRYMAVVACKMHAVRRSFLIPMIFASPATLGAFVLAVWVPFLQYKEQFNNTMIYADYCSTFVIVPSPGLGIVRLLLSDLTRNMCNHTMADKTNSMGFGLLGSSLVSWWLGLVLCTLYIWFLDMGRIVRTKDLFVRNLYEAAFIDQSMLLNTKFEIALQPKQAREHEKVTIYLCATMWHETLDEMMKMIISMFRLDKFRPKKNQFNDVVFESHIYFDDAFLTKGNKRCVNEYAETLVEVIRNVYVIFTEDSKSVFRNRKLLPDQKIFQTPYGCRLQYTLPHGNMLFVHFKDKHQIRHKKRWSQIMYMYYLLGWRLHKKYYDMYLEGDEQLIVIGDQLKKAKENTYVLALDGDTDFQPSAVMLLVDRLRLYPEVGAACGRIHPTGTGPMVWYQKFEYAVGHWLQKTAEHVFGSVLCSPGCFSLMRAEALMSDNVMKKYTTKATEASHYVQYDQGEDRWLCTLLLQQGWRVEYNAASDSYTNAPQEFKEFYNQRRRWGPSTMANTLDLLSSGSITAQLNKSISRPYILYQIIAMAASILGPATVCLMIAGSFKFIFEIDANLALVMAIVPPAVYIILCYCLGHAKSDLQISIAGIMSIFYAFLMTATILSIVGDLVVQQTFMTPSGLFFIGIIVMYITTALLHPHEFQLIIYGFIYMICIPSGYLLLSIYSMVNMNNVSWGTRESVNTTGGPEENIQKNVKCRKMFKLCGYNFEFQVNTEEKVMSAVPVNAPEATLMNDDCKVLTQPIERIIHAQEEENFWMDLIEQYLKPLETDKKKEEKVKADLKDLRNKASFVFFICNALWLVATFFLQAIGTAVSITIPKVYSNGSVDPNAKIFIDPIGLMFLLSFASLLIIQFLAMLWHRVQTLTHFIAYIGTEAEVKRNMRNQAVALMSENSDEIPFNCEVIYIPRARWLWEISEEGIGSRPDGSPAMTSGTADNVYT